MVKLTIFFLLLSTVCMTTKVEGPAPIQYDFEIQPGIVPPITKGKYLGKFRVTFYWIVKEEEYSSRKKDTPIYLEDGKLLGYFPRSFVNDFKKESCARLRDGRLISFLKKADRARVVTEPLGYNNFYLKPLKSIAVDKTIIPVGAKVYIPNAHNLYLGQEGIHNGIFYAHDIGSNVRGHHIDIFLGYKENQRYLLSAGIKSSSLVDVYLLE